LDSGTLHSGWVRLALGHRRPSWTKSSSFLSVTEERAHAFAGRIWLLPVTSCLSEAGPAYIWLLF
jgi:hypothetical protein